MANNEQPNKAGDSKNAAADDPTDFAEAYGLPPALLAGAGFTGGLGWLWFGELAELWLPNFLWGGLFSGGGASLFYLLLTLGFLGLYVVAAGLEKRRPVENETEKDWRLGRFPHFAHAAAFFLIVLAAGWPGFRLSMSYGPVVSLAGAGLLLSAYWGSILLSLSPRQSLTASVFATICAIGWFILCSVAPASGRGLLLILAMPLAWIMAREFSVYLKRQKLVAKATPPPKRSRGRPSMKTARTREEPPISRPDKWLYSLLVIGFFVLTLGQTVADSGQHFKNPALSLLFSAIGLLAAQALSLVTAWPQIRPVILPASLLCSSLLLEGALLFPGLAYWPGHLAGGLFYGTALCVLAETNRLNVKVLRRTALILAIMTILANRFLWIKILAGTAAFF